MWQPTMEEASVIAGGLILAALAFKWSFNRAVAGNPVFGLFKTQPVPTPARVTSAKTSPSTSGMANNAPASTTKTKGGWGWNREVHKEEHSGQNQTVNITIDKNGLND